MNKGGKRAKQWRDRERAREREQVLGGGGYRVSCKTDC